MDSKDRSVPKEVGFRVSPRTMQMLGRENISSPVIAVMELVKNAYDADATKVTVRFRETSTDSGYIDIEDDGEGMELTDLVGKWMVISTDNKRHTPETKKGRIKVGEKGIGRLAMDRLANKAIITTHRDDSKGLQLELDWSKYDVDEGELHEIKHPLNTVKIEREVKSGTVLHLENLRDHWTQRDYKTLHEDLALLVPPFEQNKVDFSIYFDCDEAPDLSGPVTNPAVEAAEYRLHSLLTIDGCIHHKLVHRSGETREDERPWDKAFDDVPPGGKPACGPLEFTLFYYLDDSSYLKKIGVKRAELRQFLDQFQGIRIYRDNFRVKPYGDPRTDDWLGLNLRKVRSNVGVGSTGYKISQNQVVGSVFISRYQNSNLQDQTNREGLVNNTAYLDLKKFVLDGMQFLERERHLWYLRENPKPERESLDILSESSIKLEELETIAVELREYINKINLPLFEDSEARQYKEKANALTVHVEQAAKQVNTQIQQVQITYEDQQTERQLLLGLATLGIAMTTFGHETMRAVNNLLNRTKFLKDTIKYLPEEYKKEAERDLQMLTTAAEKIKTWGEFALDRIRLDKRTQKSVSINQLANDVLHAFEGEMERRHIKVDKEKLFQELPGFRAFAMDIEAILINFITNAIEAMRYTPLDDRIIKIETDYDSIAEVIVLRFADSGRGIESKDIDKIFDPLFSTKVDKDGNPVGTGMGLTIIKNVVEDHYVGRIEVIGHGELGGAEFLIFLPHRYKEKIHYEQ